MGGVNFQLVDMEPERHPGRRVRCNIEADVLAAADNEAGYGAGDFASA